MASHTSCKPIFTVSAIRNDIPKIRNQKHTNRVHITAIHICIHTHNNSNTQTHGETHTRNTIEREIARGKESVWEREREKEVLTYDGWQRGSRRWRWQSVLEAAVVSMWGGGGGVVLRVIESEGLFESLVLRVIDLSLVVRVSWEFFQFRVFLVVERFWPIAGFSFFFFIFFIYTKPKAAFYKTQLRMNWSCV